MRLCWEVLCMLVNQELVAITRHTRNTSSKINESFSDSWDDIYFSDLFSNTPSSWFSGVESTYWFFIYFSNFFFLPRFISGLNVDGNGMNTHNDDDIIIYCHHYQRQTFKNLLFSWYATAYATLNITAPLGQWIQLVSLLGKSGDVKETTDECEMQLVSSGIRKHFMIVRQWWKVNSVKRPLLYLCRYVVDFAMSWWK